MSGPEAVTIMVIEISNYYLTFIKIYPINNVFNLYYKNMKSKWIFINT